jgi:aspartate-semialdehyde dehydrogenase
MAFGIRLMPLDRQQKVIEEMRKMFHMPHLAVVPTCIRVPVLRAHSEAITLELDKPLSPEEARGILALAPGVKLVDDAAANHFPMPIEASAMAAPSTGSRRINARRALLYPSGVRARGFPPWLKCCKGWRKTRSSSAPAIKNFSKGPK